MIYVKIRISGFTHTKTPRKPIGSEAQRIQCVGMGSCLAAVPHSAIMSARLTYFPKPVKLKNCSDEPPNASDDGVISSCEYMRSYFAAVALTGPWPLSRSRDGSFDP
jgi:hypothetical protein